jgi:purine-binding chemotaxis protein CheW
LDSTPLQRALEAAPERPREGKTAPEHEYFCFRAGDLHLGIASEHVLEVVRAGPLTPLPKVPAFILGVCAHRGEVLPVLDLLRFLAKGAARIGGKTRLVVGVSGNYVAGMVADAVTGLRRFRMADIHPVPIGGNEGGDYLVGAVRPAAAEDVVLLVDLAKLLHSARQRAVPR